MWYVYVGFVCDYPCAHYSRIIRSRYVSNTTHALPSANTVFEATRHRCVFNISGSPQVRSEGKQRYMRL